MSEYFTHDYNARQDPKILQLRSEYGWEGYGVFWAFVESLAENGGEINRNQLAGISLGIGVEKGWLEAWLNRCLDLGLFYEDDGGVIQSKRLNDHLEMRKKFSEAGKRGGKKSSKKESHPKGTLKGGSRDPLSRKGKESKEKKENKKGENAPAQEEFLQYAQEKAKELGYEWNATKVKSKYFAWKEAGWKDGKGNLIKNWKSKILNTLPYLLNEAAAKKATNKGWPQG